MRMTRPAHPGQFIRMEVIEPLGLSVTDAARNLGVPRPALSALLNGRAALSPNMVAKVSKKPEAEAERGYHGLLELRRLHRELDLAIRDAYGWQDLDLGHDFHEVETLPENDRVRYTISPAARKEVLRRLLALNHERAAAEAAAATMEPKRGKNKAADGDAPPNCFRELRWPRVKQPLRHSLL